MSLSDEFKDKYVWIEDEEISWIPALIVSNNSTSLTCEYNKKRYNIDINTAKNINGITDLQFDTSITDVMKMGETYKGSIAYLIKERYIKDNIYTAISEITIAVNPYKMISHYDINSYKELKGRDDDMINEMEPHCYSVSIRAYNYCVNDQIPQSIIISGESGAGKTESTKLCLRLLSTVGGGSGVEKKIMESSPILEIFGNAKTVRNNNSSRFGKWMFLNFDSIGKIEGTKIINYLLEKSRITDVGPHERNFHVFYSICAKDDLVNKYGLKSDPKEYTILNKGMCVVADGIDDAEFMDECVQGLNDLGFDNELIEQLFDIPGVILKIGNIKFRDMGDSVKIDDDDVKIIKKCAEILKVNSDELIKCFMNKKFRDDIVSINIDMAYKQKSTFLRDIYDKLFNYIVEQINIKINNDNIPDGEVGVGVLDIFGFEIFETNYFEQFCINWANEKLQQQFNSTTFSEKMNIMAEDGVDTSQFSFQNNDECLELIEDKSVGISSLIYDEINVPQGSDLGLVTKMIEKHSKHGYFDHIKAKRKNLIPKFIIKHFAGNVTYYFKGCLQTNQEKAPLIFIDVLKNSEHELIKTLYNVDAKKTKIVVSYFKSQLSSLMKKMNATRAHYIRCIKPNILKKPGIFDTKKSMEQLNASGVFEALRIQKQSFPYNLLHQKFVDFYRSIMWEIKSEPTVDELIEFLSNLDELSGVQCIVKGNSKVFWNDKANSLINSLRKDVLRDNLYVVQTVCKMNYIKGNYGILKLIRQGLTYGYQNESEKDIKHWMQMAIMFGVKNMFIEYEKCDYMIDILIAIQGNAITDKLKEEILQKIPDSSIGNTIQYEIPLKNLMNDVSNDETNIDKINALKVMIDDIENKYTGLDKLIEARELYGKLNNKIIITDTWKNNAKNALETRKLEDLRSCQDMFKVLKLSKKDKNVRELCDLITIAIAEEIDLRKRMIEHCYDNEGKNVNYYICKDNIKRNKNIDEGVSNIDFRSTLKMNSTKLTETEREKVLSSLKPDKFQLKSDTYKNRNIYIDHGLIKPEFNVDDINAGLNNDNKNEKKVRRKKNKKRIQKKSEEENEFLLYMNLDRMDLTRKKKKLQEIRNDMERERHKLNKYKDQYRRFKDMYNKTPDAVLEREMNESKGKFDYHMKRYDQLKEAKNAIKMSFN